jgi:hypothetical protein
MEISWTIEVINGTRFEFRVPEKCVGKEREKM